MRIDLEPLDPRAVYALLTSVIVPRPIAWVGTRSTAGVSNLAPFSYFMGVSSDPPLVAISVARGRAGALKDTARNLLENRVCTISLASMELLMQLHASSAPYGPDESEFEALGLASVDGDRVAAPRPADCKLALECELHSAQDLGTTHLFLLRVLCVHAEPGRYDGRVVAFEGLDPVARLGGAYTSLGEEIVFPPARVPGRRPGE